ncbi:hemerythrin [Nocardioides psychrotolerans]|uniref:Hemerythrin HHE cation binding domain-containing protein n=1 Tax=Nocardioides psychrotolerans TaxID=1005945 RepID=A0A1I3ETS2_9ACTN|nr:hemerythrin domain-containing protein [Nocardioides psychrotolerans]GEP39158.1 hemerythrin [Nocardioides psychrotolerans]SFI02011.1 Hemerythrin HHE cation binding domain-containing protein [Nocardioides psychrotolerans]
MCEYCGCRQVVPIGELMDEHSALVDAGHYVRRDLGAGDHAAAMSRLTDLIAHLDRHVRREEDGIFRAMREAGEFVEEIDELEGEHRDLAETIGALDIDSADFATRVTALLDDLEVHVEREDLGIFPVSVVTLGASGWAIVDDAHAESPSFLHDATPPVRPS